MPRRKKVPLPSKVDTEGDVCVHPNEKQINECWEVISDQQSECDKQLLTLSSAFLAVSIAFVKDIVKLPDAKWLWMLDSAWGLLGLCTLLVLFSFQLSIAGHYKSVKYWEDQPEKPEEEFPTAHAKAIRRLNHFCLLLFTLGVFFLIAFITLNVHREATLTHAQDGAPIRLPQEDTIKKGANVKTPPPVVKPAPPPSTGQGQGKK